MASRRVRRVRSWPHHVREWLERAPNQYDRMRFTEYLSKVHRRVEHHKLARERFVVRYAESVPQGETTRAFASP